MRASVLLTCFCWLLVPVSEPASPSRRGAPCSGPLDSPPESQQEWVERGAGTGSRAERTGPQAPY